MMTGLTYACVRGPSLPVLSRKGRELSERSQQSKLFHLVNNIDGSFVQ